MKGTHSVEELMDFVGISISLYLEIDGIFQHVYKNLLSLSEL